VPQPQFFRTSGSPGAPGFIFIHCAIIVIRFSYQQVLYINTVTVSSRYQVVIPQKVRQALHIQPGQKMQMIEYGQQILMIPVRPIREARGSLPGIDTDPRREKVDRDL
jgi:AbrB family looped-hinge helix DNA binding protein